MRKPQPPPFRPLAVSVVVERLRIVLPIAAVALLVAALSPGLAVLLMSREPTTTATNTPQEWTVGASPLAMASMAQGSLPPPDPRQKRKPCNPDFEVEIEGLCWVQLVAAKCPPDAIAHGGKCLWRVLKAEKLPQQPTSGEQRPLGVADP